MQIIKPNCVEIIQEDMYKHIEICGRTCYKSEDKITEDSAVKFVNMLRNRKHGAMLEHGNVYLTIPVETVADWVATESLPNLKWLEFVRKLPYSRCNMENNLYYITTNYRVIIDNDLENLVEKYGVVRTYYHPKRRTFKFTCNRGVSHEFVRHRVMSFAQESQRYCSYNKGKFGGEIKVIKPLYYDEEVNHSDYMVWKTACEEAETSYMTLLKYGSSPQQAREVLPNSCATELIMTGFDDQWEGFFKLRCASDAHPQAQEVANICKSLFYGE